MMNDSNSAELIPPSPDLRKDFETPPYSSAITVGSQAELRCHPPPGRPSPAVTGWLRNGVPLDTSQDNNLILSSSGHLLILQARLADTANYSCVASNLARRRTSPKATLTVYGEWVEEGGGAQLLQPVNCWW